MYKHLFKDNIYSNLDIDSDEIDSDDNISENKSILVKFDGDELKYENQQTSRMSADSSVGANNSNNAESQNDINDAAWNPVGDSPVIAPVPATTEVPPIEEVRPVDPVAQAEPAAQAEPTNPVQAESENVPAAPAQQESTVQETLAAVQEVLSTSISNLRVEIPEPSDSDDDMPPLVSSSENSEEYSDESNTDSKEDSDASKTESEYDSKESEENSEESKDSDDDLMVAVFQRPTCPRCDAALKALLTPSDDESETDSSGSDSSRAYRIRPTRTEIPAIIITLFKILLFLHVVQFLTHTFTPIRRTYS
jgi:hypothetical protein